MYSIKAICKHCNNLKGQHRAIILQCPVYIDNIRVSWSNGTIYYPEAYKDGVEVKEIICL